MASLIDKALVLSARFRRAIERARDDDLFAGNPTMTRFPAACCGEASELLARYLLESSGIRSIYRVGEYRECLQPHAWLALRGTNIFVDITGDQFRTECGALHNERDVYVGPPDDFYALFEPCYPDGLDYVAERGPMPFLDADSAFIAEYEAILSCME